MINCNYSNSGCNGGYASNSLDYLLSEGLLTETCLPFESSSGTTRVCSYQCDDPSTTYRKYFCKPFSLKILTTTYDIMSEIENNGPVMVSMSGYSDFLSYSDGVYAKSLTATYEGELSVKLIGWNYDANSNLFWIGQNHWGTDWGIDGFFQIYDLEGGINTFAMACDPDL